MSNSNKKQNSETDDFLISESEKLNTLLDKVVNGSSFIKASSLLCSILGIDKTVIYKAYFDKAIHSINTNYDTQGWFHYSLSDCVHNFKLKSEKEATKHNQHLIALGLLEERGTAGKGGSKQYRIDFSKATDNIQKLWENIYDSNNNAQAIIKRFEDEKKLLAKKKKEVKLSTSFAIETVTTYSDDNSSILEIESLKRELETIKNTPKLEAIKEKLEEITNLKKELAEKPKTVTVEVIKEVIVEKNNTEELEALRKKIKELESSHDIVESINDEKPVAKNEKLSKVDKYIYNFKAVLNGGIDTNGKEYSGWTVLEWETFCKTSVKDFVPKEWKSITADGINKALNGEWDNDGNQIFIGYFQNLRDYMYKKGIDSDIPSVIAKLKATFFSKYSEAMYEDTKSIGLSENSNNPIILNLRDKKTNKYIYPKYFVSVLGVELGSNGETKCLSKKVLSRIETFFENSNKYPTIGEENGARLVDYLKESCKALLRDTKITASDRENVLIDALDKLNRDLELRNNCLLKNDFTEVDEYYETNGASPEECRKMLYVLSSIGRLPKLIDTIINEDYIDEDYEEEVVAEVFTKEDFSEGREVYLENKFAEFMGSGEKHFANNMFVLSDMQKETEEVVNKKIISDKSKHIGEMKFRFSKLISPKIQSKEVEALFQKHETQILEHHKNKYLQAIKNFKIN